MPLALSTVLVLLQPHASGGTETPSVELKVTHRNLVPVCLDGAFIDGRRSWRLASGSHTMVLTMRNDPRQGTGAHQRVVPKSEPGFAAVSFDLEAGHRYEIEVRAPDAAYSLRVWEREEWSPVVRDRTAERIVSGGPGWADTARCRP